MIAFDDKVMMQVIRGNLVVKKPTSKKSHLFFEWMQRNQNSYGLLRNQYNYRLTAESRRFFIDGFFLPIS